MPVSVHALAILNPSYEKGLAFFRDALGFGVVEDTPVEAPNAGRPRASRRRGRTDCARRPKGRPAARPRRRADRRTGYFLETRDLDRDYHAPIARDVQF